METAGSSGNCPSNRRISIVFGPGADLGGRSELPLRIVLRLRVTFRESTACSDELDLLGRCVLPRDRHAKCRTAVVDLDQRRLVLERAALDLPDDGHPAAEPRGRHEEVRRLQDENERLDARVRDVGDRHGDVSEPCGVSLVCVPQADVGRAEQAAPQRIARRRVELREAGESGRAAEIDVGVELDERVLGETASPFSLSRRICLDSESAWRSALMPEWMVWRSSTCLSTSFPLRPPSCSFIPPSSNDAATSAPEFWRIRFVAFSTAPPSTLDSEFMISSASR